MAVKFLHEGFLLWFTQVFCTGYCQGWCKAGIPGEGETVKEVNMAIDQLLARFITKLYSVS